MSKVLVACPMGREEARLVSELSGIKLRLKNRIIFAICQLIPPLKRIIDEKVMPIKFDVRAESIPWIENDEKRRVVIFNFPLTLQSLDSMQLEKLSRAIRSKEVAVVANRTVCQELMKMTTWNVFYVYEPKVGLINYEKRAA